MVNPVVVVPGIKGSGLENYYQVGGAPTWGTWQAIAGTGINNLLPTVDGEVDFADDVVTRATYVLGIAYGKFIEGLRARLEVPVYIFPYDWRQSSRLNGERLTNFIELLRRKPMNSLRGWAAGDRLVNVVGHSMGGMVIRSALSTWASRQTKAPIDNAVFIATPHYGSLDAIRAMVTGDSPILDFNKELRKLARALPSAYELLPTFDKAVIDANGVNLDIFSIANWQSNVTQTTDGIQDVTQQRLTDAKKFLSTLPLPTAAKLGVQGEAICLYGKKAASTLCQVPVDAAMGTLKNVYRFDRGQMGDGDEVVPMKSAILEGCEAIEIPYSDVGFWPTELPARVNMHAFICVLDEVQTVVSRFLKKPLQKSKSFLPINLALSLESLKTE